MAWQWKHRVDCVFAWAIWLSWPCWQLTIFNVRVSVIERDLYRGFNMKHVSTLFSLNWARHSEASIRFVPSEGCVWIILKVLCIWWLKMTALNKMSQRKQVEVLLAHIKSKSLPPTWFLSQKRRAFGRILAGWISASCSRSIQKLVDFCLPFSFKYFLYL